LSKNKCSLISITTLPKVFYILSFNVFIINLFSRETKLERLFNVLKCSYLHLF
jgi:hypothetical protein